MKKRPVSRLIITSLILLAGFLSSSGCASTAPLSETPGQKPAPVTADRTQSK